MTNLDLFGFFFRKDCVHYVSNLYLHGTIRIVFNIQWTAAIYKLIAKENRYFLIARNQKICLGQISLCIGPNRTTSGRDQLLEMDDSNMHVQHHPQRNLRQPGHPWMTILVPGNRSSTIMNRYCKSVLKWKILNN